MPETFHSPQQVEVFILYLLEKIGYPLDYNDIATIVIRDGFVDYFDFVTYFHELLEANHIARIPREEDGESSVSDRDMYTVSDTGRLWPPSVRQVITALLLGKSTKITGNLQNLSNNIERTVRILLKL
jgi:hypothetical protein